MKAPKKACSCSKDWVCEACKIALFGSRIAKTPDGGEILVVKSPRGSHD